LKRKYDWLGAARIEELICDVFLSIRQSEIEEASHGNGNFPFRQTLFIQFALNHLAVMVSDVGRDRVAIRNANTG
jgi:hypothetical protein